MKLNRRNTVMIGLCVAGLAVFIYDRVRPDPDLIGPETASASVGSPPAVPVPALQVAAPADATRAGGPKIAEHLAAVASRYPEAGSNPRDAFRVPDSWLPASPQAAAAQPLAEDSEQARADAFPRKHPLQAVMVSGSARQAVIGGQCLVVGQRLDGFVLLSIGELSVILASPGGTRVTLAMPDARKAP